MSSERITSDFLPNQVLLVGGPWAGRVHAIDPSWRHLNCPSYIRASDLIYRPSELPDVAIDRTLEMERYELRKVKIGFGFGIMESYALVHASITSQEDVNRACFLAFIAGCMDSAKEVFHVK